ncbi:urea carboxylase-associated family protein, partial [Mycobacterium sp. NPDC003449]
MTVSDVTRARHVCTVEGGRGGGLVLRAGQRLHIVNTLGYQVVDTWALKLGGASVMSMSHSRLAMGRLSPRVGDTLVDDLRAAMLTVVADDSGGVHDTLIPACDPERYRALGFRDWHASCADNFRQALDGLAVSDAAVGSIARRAVPDPLNVFMAVEASLTGELSLKSSVAVP